MSFDVFISYSTKDMTAAKAACAALEAAKIRCWMAPRDILPGARWGASIVRAINGCRVMVLIFSGNANASAQVHREVDQAFGKGRAVLPLRIEDVRPADELAYYLDTVHWLDALTPPLETNLEKLVATVRALLPMTEPVPAISEPSTDDSEAARQEDEARAEDERRLKDAEATEAAQRDQEAATALRQKQEAEAQRLAVERRQREEDAKRRADEAERRAREENEAKERAEQERRAQEAEAKQRAEAERAFAKAKRADTVAALDEFLAAYPASHLVAEAQTLRMTLAERDDAYKSAMASNDAAVLKAFLERYPNSKPVGDARKRLRRLQPRPFMRRPLVIAGLSIVGAICAVMAFVGLEAFSQWHWQNTSGPNRIISGPQLSQLNSVSFSPDGKRLITASSSLYSNCKNPTLAATCGKLLPEHGIQIWDVSTGTRILTLTGAEDDWNAIFSPDGQEIAWDNGKTITIADAATGKPIRTLKVAWGDKGIWTAGDSRIVVGAHELRSFSADSKFILTDTQIWNVSTGRLQQTFPEACIPASAFSPDAKRIVTWGGPVLPDGYDRTGDQVVCDAQSGKTLATLFSSTDDTHLAFFPDGKRIVGSDSFLRIWDADTGSLIKSLLGADNATMSADGKLLAGSWFNTVSIWNGDSYALIKTLYSPIELNFHDVLFAPDGGRLIGFDNSHIEIWDLAGTSS